LFVSSSSGLERQGKLFIISAPAGAGKNTLVNLLKQQLPHLKETISCTTRLPRLGEEHGRDYFFMSPQEFQTAIDQNELLEWVELYGHRYGTLKQQIFTLQSKGYDVVMIIDTQGAIKIKQQLQATLIFICPPSMNELRLRLKKRATESEEVIAQRLIWAEQEMEQKHFYDHAIVNDILDQACLNLKKIFESSESINNF
jgi:guanylate kinase